MKVKTYLKFSMIAVLFLFNTGTVQAGFMQNIHLSGAVAGSGLITVSQSSGNLSNVTAFNLNVIDVATSNAYTFGLNSLQSIAYTVGQSWNLSLVGFAGPVIGTNNTWTANLAIGLFQGTGGTFLSQTSTTGQRLYSSGQANTQPVPEPSTLLMLALALLGAYVIAMRKRRHIIKEATALA